jgi:hypothetical protein
MTIVACDLHQGLEYWTDAAKDFPSRLPYAFLVCLGSHWTTTRRLMPLNLSWNSLCKMISRWE